MKPKDCAGNEFHVGAIVKVFHFIGARYSQKHYMYKQVVAVHEDGRVDFAHLPIKDVVKRDYSARDRFDDYLIIADPEFEVYNRLNRKKNF